MYVTKYTRKRESARVRAKESGRILYTDILGPDCIHVCMNTHKPIYSLTHTHAHTIR